MCLEIDTTIHPTLQPLTAVEDIHVVKVLDVKRTFIATFTYLSPYRRFEYKPNVLNELINLEPEKIILSNLLVERVIDAVTKGYHAFWQIDGFPKKSVGIRLARFVIPKGTKYFIGLHDDIVAEQIMMLPMKPNKDFDLSEDSEDHIMFISKEIKFAKWQAIG